jgi:hypothetical protein
LRRWALIANAKGRYSRGSSETMLDQDINAINKGNDVAGMEDNLKQQFGRLTIEPDDLSGRNQRSGLFKTMFLAFKDDGAKDWHTRLAISMAHSGNKHKLQFHHIFPKAYLSGKYENKKINDIANLSFISGGTNRKISATPPSTYFPEVIKEHGTELFDKQCVPTSDNVLTLETYPEFLKIRREMISRRLNQFVESVVKDAKS